MKVYNYARGTGEFIGESIAPPSPLEPGKFLIPAWSTHIKPPTAKKGKMAVFSDDKWAFMDDHRGKIVYSVTDGEPFTISELGPLPAGFTETARPSPDHVWGGKKWEFDGDLNFARLSREVRASRDAFLKQTDWAMLPDVDPIHRVKYGEYRQKLRDITKQPGFPDAVEWPDKP